MDDDADIRLCYRMILEPRFRVIEAGDGREALEVLAAKDVALAVVDVHMPVMNGVELIRALRADPELRELPVIVQTSDQAALRAPVWTDLQVAQTVMKADFMAWMLAQIDEHIAVAA